MVYLRHHAHQSDHKKGIVMISYIRIFLFIIGLSIISHCSAAYDNGHFYRATNAFFEPRLERDCLTSFLITLGGGSTDDALNACGQTVPLFDIYGFNNMQQLGVGVPNKNLQNNNDLILIQLANLPTNDTFGKLSICGRFSIVESNIFLSQNFTDGFFMQVHLPIRNLKVSDINFIDISPGTSLCNPFNGRCPNTNTPIWQTFLNNFGNILNQYGISVAPFNKTGIGDLTVLFGWTINYQKMEALDYIDASIRFGFLAPTSPKTSINDLFALPLGYDGHWGFPLSFDLAIGAYQWATIGGHIDAIIFADTDRFLRMKTSLAQRGIIKLAAGCAQESRGTLWNGNVYFKADHVIQGFSLLLGISFTKQNESSLTPSCNQPFFDPVIVNSDAMLQGWKMYTFHVAAEYDFTCNDSYYGTKVGIFYNGNVGGERIFRTGVVGGQFGIDITHKF